MGTILTVSGVALVAGSTCIVLNKLGKKELEKYLSLLVSLGLIVYAAKLTKEYSYKIINLFGGWPL